MEKGVRKKQCAKGTISESYSVFHVFEALDFHHFSPFSPFSHLHFLSLSPLLSSPLLLSVVFRCLRCGRFFFVLCCCRLCFLCVVSLLLLLLRCCWCFCRRSSCCCCWCCWWVLRVLERLFLGSIFLNFCLFSLSFRPLLSSCQVHFARRVACT